MPEPAVLCSVFRSERKEGAYLYTPLKTGGDALEDIPAELLRQLGALTEVMKLKLTPNRKLANADAGRVIQQLQDCGYYLQLPPTPADKPGSREP